MEQHEIISTPRKALAVNLDKTRYGSFAEIGAGQEVARYFFKAGLASQTIAKTMSAYDMKFSDEIYGREDSGRYVVESRLHKMLDHEFNLLESRLSEERGKDTAFFAFANTVATSSKKNRSHGWMGVRFQKNPGEDPCEVFIHVKMLDNQRLQQQEAVGIMGVNLVHAAFFACSSQEQFVGHLMDNLNSQRIEIDMVNFMGRGFTYFDNRLASLELVRQGFTPAILFNQKGEVTQVAENLFNRPVLVQRGNFRPFTNTNDEIVRAGLEQICPRHKDLNEDPLVILEISMNDLGAEAGSVDSKDFVDRIDTLKELGYHVLVSKFPLFYQLKSYLRQSTSKQIYIVVGAKLLEKIFDDKYYDEGLGGPLAAFGQLFDTGTQLLVFPFKTDNLCMTASSFFPKKSLAHIYRFLMENEYITDISGCDHVDTSLHSEDVRSLLLEGDPQWEKLVPNKIAKLIKQRKLFGLHK